MSFHPNRMKTVRTPNILPVHSLNVLDGMSIVYVFHILLGSKNFLIFYPFMYILVAYPEHPHGMRDANIPLYIPGISLGWRVLVGVVYPSFWKSFYQPLFLFVFLHEFCCELIN